MTPELMRAVEVAEPGGPEVLHLTERPVPEPAATEVRVRVTATGVNPVDWKTRSGKGFLWRLAPPPYVLGWDVAGVVDAVGPGVTRFARGDRVLGFPRFPREAGAYAEYLTAPSRQLARTPDELDDASAAALPLAGLTAWQALVDTASVRPGQRVLVNAAAGGVGHLAVQIAKHLGAYVIGTASAAKHDLLRSLGVDEPVDYRAVDLGEAVRDVDLVLDLVGGTKAYAPIACVRPGGLLISIPSGFPPELVSAGAERGVRVTGMIVEPDHVGLEALTDLVRAGELRVLVARRYPLDRVAEAHAELERGRTTGKIVLVP